MPKDRFGREIHAHMVARDMEPSVTTRLSSGSLRTLDLQVLTPEELNLSMFWLGFEGRYAPLADAIDRNASEASVAPLPGLDSEAFSPPPLPAVPLWRRVNYAG